MKKLLSLILCLVLVLTAVPMTASAEQVTINVYNWGQYISDGTDGYIDVNKAFTEATGIKVNYMTFDSNETMYTKLKTGGSTYDVIIPSDYMIARLISEDMLLEIDHSNIPNYADVDERTRTPPLTRITSIQCRILGVPWVSSTTKNMLMKPTSARGICCGTASIPARYSCSIIPVTHLRYRSFCWVSI